MSVEFDDSMSISSLEDLVIDGSGDIYAIGRDSDSEVASLHRFDGVAWSSWEISGESSLLAVGPDGSVWLAEREGGIYNIRDGQWGIDLKEGSPIAEISAIQVAPDGSVWVGSTNGAWRFDGLKWTSFMPENALLSGFVSEIAISNDGTIWFGGLGLARYGPP
jgi:streptogramin lyase